MFTLWITNHHVELTFQEYFPSYVHNGHEALWDYYMLVSEYFKFAGVERAKALHSLLADQRTWTPTTYSLPFGAR